MTTTIDITTPALSSAAVQETSAFLERHGRGLCNLVDILDDAAAIDACFYLESAYAANDLCPHESRAALEIIRDALEGVSVPETDRLAKSWSEDVSVATRWYGARLTDLIR